MSLVGLVLCAGLAAEDKWSIRASPCHDSAPAYAALAGYQQFGFAAPGPGVTMNATYSSILVPRWT